jgi:hypothetical protein
MKAGVGRVPWGRARVPAQAAKLRQRDLDGGVIVAEALGPEVLIETLDRRPVLAEDQAAPHGEDQLGVGQVLDDTRDGPLPRRLGSPEPRVRNPLEPVIEPRHELAQHLERLPRAEQVEQRAHVGGRGGRGAARRVGKGHRRSGVTG